MRLLITLLLLMITANTKAGVEKIGAGWEFRQVGHEKWYGADVPGTVHTDLMAQGIIDDPFMEQNERDVQWVDKTDWEYRTVFDAEEGAVEAESELVFYGLDTYADVYLNEELVLKADNMFRTWRINTKGLLKQKDNSLRIYFHSPLKVDLPKWRALNYQYMAWNDQSEQGGVFDQRVSVFARKAGYHYGWDWGPRLVTSGVWRPIELHWWKGVSIKDAYFRQETNAKVAHVSETVTLMSDGDCTTTLTVKDKATGKALTSKSVALKEGENEVVLNFSIKSPKLWWSNGLGKPHLYNFVTEVEGQEQRVDRIGLRSIRLLNEPDSIGREFCFELNGKRVFMKGADYIPCDNFLTRVNDSIYRKTIEDAAAVNMNMLRVWGGGVYEDDRFYNLCDEMGILVWQDFMFACSVYPAEGSLMESIKAEARDNIVRLRNHACLALWCGNNECQDALYGWGWKTQYEKQGEAIAKKVEKEFEDLYYKVLPEMVEKYNPDTRYWPSSPFGEYNKVSSETSGDYHYWRVWHGNEPISEYNVHRARFYSEYGMQSFPEFEAVKQFNPDPEQWDIHSEVMMAHQRGGAFANSRIEGYLESEYTKPNDFRELLYAGQLMQGDAMKTAVEAHRRDKGYCWGTLIWQINDCWPVASWSTRDWYGRWKAAHYMIRKAMDDVLVSPIEKDGRLQVWIVNDRLKGVKGTLTLSIMDMRGKSLYQTEKRVSIGENCSTMVFEEATEQLLSGNRKENVVVTAVLDADRQYTADYIFLKSKYMNWQKPQLDMHIEEQADGSRWLCVKSDVFVKGLFAEVPGEINPFADNYINLLPQKEQRIKINSALPTAEIEKRIRLVEYYSATTAVRQE